MRIAAIDIGTNTALLTIAVVHNNGLEVLHEEERFIRLGEGVDQQGVVCDAAIVRLIRVLKQYKAIALRFNCLQICIGATSASRDAINRDEIIRRVRNETDLQYTVMSGDAEGNLTMLGVLSACSTVRFPLLVIDVGGGSTELSWCYQHPSSITDVQQWSLQMGAVRITERFFFSSPPGITQIEAARLYIEHQLNRVSDFPQPQTVIGADGTVTTLAQIVEPGISTTGPLASLHAQTVQFWQNRLLGISSEELLNQYPKLMKGRSDVFAAGVLILNQCLRHFKIDKLQVSHRGFRHGLLVQAMADGVQNTVNFSTEREG